MTETVENQEVKCFLCEEVLTNKTRSEEHVIPKWMQEDYQLWNHKLGLANKTPIRYRQILIPCCKECNNVHLKTMEEEFQKTIYRSNRTLDELSDLTIMQWAAKVLYGIIYKERSLPLDRTGREAGTIWDDGILSFFGELRLFLLSVREPTVFACEGTDLPATIYKFNAQWSRGMDAVEMFDLMTSIAGRALAIRIKNRAYVIVFDGGLQQLFPAPIAGLVGENSLHPQQFKELAAYIVSQAVRCCAAYSYGELQVQGKRLVVQSGLRSWGAPGPNGEMRTFHDHDFDVFLEILEAFTGRKQRPEVHTLRRHFTLLLNEDNGFKVMPLGDAERQN